MMLYNYLLYGAKQSKCMQQQCCQYNWNNNFLLLLSFLLAEEQMSLKRLSQSVNMTYLLLCIMDKINIFSTANRTDLYWMCSHRIHWFSYFLFEKIKFLRIALWWCVFLFQGIWVCSTMSNEKKKCGKGDYNVLTKRMPFSIKFFPFFF